MTEDDIKDNTENRHECFGIIVPDYLLQQYVESWFDGMTNKNFVKIKSYIVGNRSVINETFRVALQKYLRQLSMGKIETLIQSGNIDFVNSMFVMTDENVKDIADDLYEYFGIVIPNDLLHHYSERWLDDLRKTDSVKEYIDRNRSVSDVAFRIAMQAYIKNLPRAKILNLLQTGSTEFVNTMFVMTEGDIKDNTGNQWECFGIVLPGDLLQQYIVILFDGLTKVDSVKKYTEANRCLMNANFQNTMQTYIKQLNRAEIENLIQTGSRYFLNTMFVMMEDDIKDNTDNRYECLGIILPDDMLQQYIGRWFDCITKTELVAEYIRENRLLMNVTGRATIQNYIRHITEGTIETLIQSGNKAFFNTMFVTTEYFIKDTAVNRYAYVGIVIPDNLLQQYIERWFNNLTKTDTVREYINCNRCVNANTFRIALQTYIKQLTRRKIGNLQRTASQDFVNTMFVMTEDDIKDNAEHQWECLGIVLPDDLLQQYIERLFDGLTKANLVKKSIDANRCFMNGTFRIALQTYIKQLTHGKIRNLIQTGSRDFVNTMFVMTEDDIKENTVNRLECFGIVVVDDMLQQYFERWFDSVTRTESVKEDMNVNRILMNATGKAAMQHYIRRINEKRIGTLIQIGNRDFFNTMFVVTEDDIKDNADNRYECFGIIIPADLLEQYIGRLVDGLTKTDSVKKCLDFNRCFMNVTFRIALQTYMKQLTRGNIANLIQTGSRDFVNTMFVLAEDDIKEDSENRQECFGIIMPDDLLHQYIERWFDGMTKTDSAKQYIDENRTFMNSKFQANLDLYINGINLEKIRCLNRKGQIDYLNTRQGLFKENRTYEIKS
ncbi:unnamed protein product [Mytilus coruscus]|uniref:Uncharacterized protein n=1 Tax=Mytilus coruscus TaxID=42192 RepID=A0A6J8B8M2_MYTCO|nr:unnamed protein product [Mytilus coruscus]